MILLTGVARRMARGVWMFVLGATVCGGCAPSWPSLLSTPLLAERPRYETACGWGRTGDCVALGDCHARAGGGPILTGEAVKHYERACDLGDVRGCTELALILAERKEDPLGPPRAVELLHEACDLGDAKACVSYGVILDVGALVDPDVSQAFVRFRRALALDWPACETEHDGEACVRAAYLLMEGRGVEVDQVGAVRLLEEACAYGVASACSDAGDYYSRGIFIAKDYLHAHELHSEGMRLLESSCSRGWFRACHTLGTRYYAGEGAYADPVRAIKFLTRACAARELQACVDLGDVFAVGEERPRDAGEAERFFRLACDTGHAEGCHALERFRARQADRD